MFMRMGRNAFRARRVRPGLTGFVEKDLGAFVNHRVSVCG